MIDELVRAASESDWERARQLLHAHWQDQCPKLFAPNQDAPWDISYDECAINSLLFRPLAAAYVQNSQTPSPSLLPLNEEAGTNPEDRRPGQICGHVFKTGEPTYSCRECATDPTCVLCHKCFTQSVHAQHKYRMSTSGGSGYCDCGDADAWTTGYACSLHAISEEKQDLGAIVSIPPQLHERVRGLTTLLLQYSTKMICFQDGDAIPEFIMNPPDLTPPFQTILFNDETHTYEAVIRALDMAIHCSKNHAMLLATIVDREGRSSVKAGMRGECDRVKQDIQRRTSRDTNRRTERSGPLDVKVMESAFVAHQAHAIQLIGWLNQQTEHFPALSDIIGEVLLSVESVNNNVSMEVDGQEIETLVVKIMRSDRKLWKAARNNFHQLLMKTVLMHMHHKLEFSRQFLKHYEEMYNEFVDDDHDHDMSIVALTVQFLTVPTIAKRLIAENDAISVVFRALGKHTDQYLSEPKAATSRFDFSQRSFPATLKRAMHMMKDLSYMLNVLPHGDDWNSTLRENFINGCKEFIGFLHHMQGMDEVKRLSVEHQVWELEWETAFNMQLRIQEIITMILAWAASDKEAHQRLLAVCLEACTHHKPSTLEPSEANGATHVLVEVNGESTAVGCFDILKGAVSIHQPIYRLLAGLFAVDKSFLHFLEPDFVPTNTEEIQLRAKIMKMEHNLYEMSLRVLVLCAQSSAGLWRRNGFSLVNQIHNYLSPLCRNEMMDKDLLLVQVGAALTKPSSFLLHFMHRYRVSNWADSDFDGHSRSNTPYGNKIEPEESSKITVNLAEDMLHMLIIICGERFLPGVGVCTKIEQLNREVLHILCMGPQPFSVINKRMSQDPMLKQLCLDEAVKNVGEFRKPTVTSAGTFYLKDDMRSQYNPFFYHYSKTDLSQAEQFQQKSRSKSERSLIACPPPVPVQFAPFFEPIRQILRSPTLIKVHRVVLERVAKRSRFSSDRLLHRSLYLIGMGLHEQANDLKEFDFVGEADRENILPFMESLSGKPESQGHSDLLWWTISKYKEVQRLASSNGEESEEKRESSQKEESADEAKKRRQEMAAKMRAHALNKMQKMQSKFLHQIKQDSAEKDEGGSENARKEKTPTSNITRIDEDEDAVGTLVDDGGFPVCLGPNKAKVETVLPRSITCILCQEEETLDVNAKPFVCAAFVQKSHLFAQRSASAAVRLDVHLVNASLEVGIDASTCSHTMHYLCYQNLSESLMARERSRPRQQMVYNQRMIDTENGEYLCPLCKRLSNTAMPLIPALHKLSINGFSSNRPAENEDFDEWVDRLRELVNTPPQAAHPKPPFKSHSRKRSHSERALNDLVKEAAKDQLSSGALENALSSSVPSASAMDLLMEGDGLGGTAGPPERTLSQANQSTLRQQLAVVEQEAQFAADYLNQLLEQNHSLASSPSASDETGRRPNPSRRSVFAFPNNVIQMIMKMPSAVIAKFSKKVVSVEKYDEMVRGFTKFIIKSRSTDEKELNDEVRGVMSAMGIWQSCAHVTRTIATVLKTENKPLFGALNTRQRDCILAIARLSAMLSYNLQPFAEIICQMLRVFLAPPPENFFSARSPSEGVQSPTYPTSPPPNDQATPTTTKLLTSPIAQFFLPSSTPQQRSKDHKEHNVNILNVDMLSLALELMMCIGWTWHDGVQSVRGFKNASLKDLVPDGSLDELHVLRLALLGLYFQVFATFEEPFETDCEMRDSDTWEVERHRVMDLWKRSRGDTEIANVDALMQTLRAATVDFLRPMALLYHAITLIPPPEALKDPYVDELEPLCRYMGLPTQMNELLEGVAIEKLFEMWSSAIPTDLQRSDLVKQPIHPNLLIDLPEDFSELINMAAKFRCPSIPLEEMTSSIPTMCLVCGQVLCSQSYCCQKQVGKDNIGACQYHMQHCSGPCGVFLRMRESQIVMMTTRNRGCMKAAPYVDEFGEADIGFRRGNPLRLNKEQYAKIRQLWLHQGIAEEVVNQFEIDHRNIGYDWDHF